MENKKNRIGDVTEFFLNSLYNTNKVVLKLTDW